MKNFFSSLGRQYLIRLICLTGCVILCIHQVIFNEENIRVGFWDICFLIFQGKERYIPQSDIPFIPPFLWIFVQTLLLYLSKEVLGEKGSSYEIQILIRMKKRKKWWRKKLKNTIVSTGITYLLLFAVVALICIERGGGSHDQTIRTLYGTDRWNIFNKIVVLWLQPFVTTLTLRWLLCFLKMFLSEKTAWIFIEAILLVSSFCMSVFLIGNHAMAIRSSLWREDGVKPEYALTLDFMIMVIIWMIGERYIEHTDLLGRKKEE